MLDQRALDAALIITAPDGKQLSEVNLTGAGEEEPLSLEAEAGSPDCLYGLARLAADADKVRTKITQLTSAAAPAPSPAPAPTC